MANDSILTLFDTAPQQSSPMFRPKGGTTYLYVSDDEAKNDWRADGFRWRQNGTRQANCSNGIS